jgi:AcrR family transcriptional regulator
MSSTRDTLIDAATTLLDSGGPEMVTLREVGRLAGVSHNAPYRHFADKRALLSAVAARELAIAINHYRKAVAGESTLQDALQDYSHRALQYPARFRLIYSDALLHDEDLERVAAETRSALADAVATAQARGELPDGDTEKLSWLLRACAYGATIRALANPQLLNQNGAAEPAGLIAELFFHLRK